MGEGNPEKYLVDLEDFIFKWAIRAYNKSFSCLVFIKYKTLLYLIPGYLFSCMR